RIDEDKLFNLFSIYGNIMRIKILRNKPDHALVQMGDGFQAELAVHFLKLLACPLLQPAPTTFSPVVTLLVHNLPPPKLSRGPTIILSAMALCDLVLVLGTNPIGGHYWVGTMLFGKRLEVNFSKHPNITQGPDTHEYMNSNLNRFNRNAAKNYRYCCSPTRIIHVSSLPQDIIEIELASLLVEHGIIFNCKVFEMNGKKQALVQFETEEEATEALVCKHASSLSGSVV
ncbi:polypyrimidine tract-binding protein 3-like, partial [Trifolium pratense]